MNIHVETVTGVSFSVRLHKNATVLELKAAINEEMRVPVYYQALVCGQMSLEDDNALLKNLAIGEHSTVKLVIKSRSGPSRFLKTEGLEFHIASDTFLGHESVASTSTGQSSTDVSMRSDVMACSVGKSEELDLTFTPERRAEAKRWTEDNLRTMNRAREVRSQINRLRLTSKKVVEGTVTSTCGPSECCSSNAAPPVYCNAQRSRMSAPEDTSAKESSAGETECEGELPLQLPSAGGSLLYKMFPNAESSSYFAPTGSWTRSSAMPHRQHHQRGSLPVRLLSSSSEPEESSGAIWTTTGSELEDEDSAALYNSCGENDDEDVASHKSDAAPEGEDREEEDDELPFFSGSPNSQHSPVSPPKPLNTVSEASELSSGMIICDLSRRTRFRKKHHVGSSATAAGQKKVARPTSARGVRTRSKGRTQHVCLMSNSNSVNVNWLAASTQQRLKQKQPDSSSDDNVLVPTDEEAASQVGMASAAAPCTQRKQSISMSNRALAAKHRSNDAQIRRHCQPQSSQSQQRCNSCGSKLNHVSLAFQCRCGKTLCSGHRQPGKHTCNVPVLRQRHVPHRSVDQSD